MFYAKLDSVLDQCSRRNAFIVLGDFDAVTGTERADYETCVGPHCSGTRNDNSSFLLNFARSRRLRVAGSWYQRPALHRWTWYNNAGWIELFGESFRAEGFFRVPSCYTQATLSCEVQKAIKTRPCCVSSWKIEGLHMCS